MAGAGMSLLLPVEPITSESFAPFGRLLTFSEHPDDERFEVLVQEAREPWRIAVFRVRQRTADRLERHTESMESFAPMRGFGVLLTAEPDRPDTVHAFALDTPVCLHKGVWHEVITLSSEAVYQITENSEVSSQFHPFKSPVGIYITNQ